MHNPRTHSPPGLASNATYSQPHTHTQSRRHTHTHTHTDSITHTQTCYCYIYRSGIRYRQEFADFGIKSHLCGWPDLTEEDFKEQIPRQTLRFMGDNASEFFVRVSFFFHGTRPARLSTSWATTRVSAVKQKNRENGERGSGGGGGEREREREKMWQNRIVFVGAFIDLRVDVGGYIEIYMELRYIHAHICRMCTYMHTYTCTHACTHN